MSLDSLYQETILDHNINPRNYGKLEEAHGHPVAIHQENPSCGDQIDLQLALDEHHNIIGIRFTGQGCAISKASASMMTEAVEGLSAEDARKIIERFRAMILAKETVETDLGDLEALQGVKKFPVRVKCAMLSWNALQKLLDEAETTPSQS